MNVPVHLENPMTPRAIEWHTPELTSRAARAVLDDSELSLVTRLDGVAVHVRHGLQRMSGVGLLGNAVEVASMPAAEGDWNGFWPLNNPAVTAVMVQRAAKGPSWLEQARARLDAVPPDELPSPHLVASIARLQATAKAAGVTLVFVRMPPQIDANVRMFGEDRRHGIEELWDLADPIRYPEFYDPALCHNPLHLNGEGAELFTDALTVRFLERLGRPSE
jgi:hypothetical protein